ncbi:MAG TPA: radical SAM/SPASM domain-containing protein [Burkholderiales bacterium]|nr:radical SAM/SPASM domain-containing protein [Burkholderiales bacterium]
MIAWLGGRAPARPFEAFQIEVTSRCNLKCVMCPVAALGERWEARDLPWETFERVAEAFGRVRWVHLQGWGEPLLHRRFFDMAARAKAAGCRVGFTTNGTRLTTANGERLLELGVDLVAVSIAGARAATHEAIRVGSDFAGLQANLRGFAALRRARGNPAPKLEVFYLMTRANLVELPQAVTLAAELGADELVATNLDYVITPELDALRAYGPAPPAPALGAAVEAAAAAARAAGIAFRPYRLQQREMAVCDLNPLKILYIGADGSVSPCVYTSLAGPDEIPRVFEGRPLETPVVRFGNVNHRPLMQIWESPAYRAFRARFARRVAGAGLALLGTAAGAAPEEELPAPEACRTCPKLYGI